MTKAFCPGHMTCFFVPMMTDDVNTIGSVGAGIKLDKGATVILEERRDRKLRCTMDGIPAECPITESAIRRISDRGFDVTIENGLPVSHGFGMSAAGAIAAAMCAATYEEFAFQDAAAAANGSDIDGRGGLGDVAAILCESHVPVRVKPGIPPYGLIEDSGIRFEKASLVFLDGDLPTGNVLGDAATVKKIISSGSVCLERFLISPSKQSLFSLSRKFSSETGLESADVSELLREIPNACMCMLGHSVFADMPADEVRDLTDAEVVECSSTNVLPFICKA